MTWKHARKFCEAPHLRFCGGGVSCLRHTYVKPTQFEVGNELLRTVCMWAAHLTHQSTQLKLELRCYNPDDAATFLKSYDQQVRRGETIVTDFRTPRRRRMTQEHSLRQ